MLGQVDVFFFQKLSIAPCKASVVHVHTCPSSLARLIASEPWDTAIGSKTWSILRWPPSWRWMSLFLAGLKVCVPLVCSGSSECGRRPCLGCQTLPSLDRSVGSSPILWTIRDTLAQASRCEDRRNSPIANWICPNPPRPGYQMVKWRLETNERREENPRAIRQLDTYLRSTSVGRGFAMG